MSTKIKSSNIESGAINGASLGDGSVSSEKLAATSVTRDKLHSNIISDQVALSSADVDAVNDFLLIYDASTTSLKKIAVENIKPDLGAIDQHIIPDTNITYDLGSSTHRFRDLYLSGNTINLGGTKISKDDDGNVEFKDSNDALKRLVAAELQLGTGASSMKIMRKVENGKAIVKFEEWDTRNPGQEQKLDDDYQPAVDLGMNDTDDLKEGSTNQYFTNSRARAAITGTGLINVASNGTISFQGDTDGISEGTTNLYFTNDRAQTQARRAITVTGDATYSNVTGALNVSAPVRSVNGDTGAVTISSLDQDFWSFYMLESDLPTAGSANHGMIVHVHETGDLQFAHNNEWHRVANKADTNLLNTRINQLVLNDLVDVDVTNPVDADMLAWNATDSKWQRTGTFTSQADGWLATKDTGDLTEGSQLFYTDSRARAAISVSGDLGYSNGVISFTERTDDEVKALVGGMVTSNSESGISVTYDSTDKNLDFAVDTATIATRSFVTQEINNVVGAAPDALNTLQELATALQDNDSDIAGITTTLGTKAAKSTTISAGSGLTGGGSLEANRTISHADTSTLSGAQTAASGSVINSVTVDGFGHVTATGTTDTIAKAGKWATARTLTLSGEVSGSASIDGSGNVNIVVDVLGGSSDSATNAATAANAQLLDGLDSTHFKNAGNLNAGTVPSARLSGTYGISISGNAATATNADQLDGQHGTYYRNANNLNAGTVPAARLSGTYGINISGTAANATQAVNADTLDGYHASHFATAAASLSYSEGTTAPSANNGSLWYNTSNGKTYMKQQGIWKQIAPGVGGTAVYDVNGNKVS